MFQPTLTLPDVWPFLLTALAVYRVSFLMTEEDGPFHIFLRWRRFAWQKLPQWIGQGFSCFYCTSFWVSLLGSACVVRSLGVELVVVWLSLAAIVTLVMREETRRNGFLSAASRQASKG